MLATPIIGQFTIAGRRFYRQLILLLAFLVGANLFLVATLEQSALQTIVWLTIVSSSGLWLIVRLQYQLADRRLLYLGYVWLGKLVLILFVLYVGWMPELPTSHITTGYDPQRYYIQAQELVMNNWSTSGVSLNYVGILYYYGILFALIGHNPVIPALLNVFTTLLATLFLVRVGYEIKAQRGPNDWWLGLAMILPEIMWFDVMTSRETILMALLTVMLLAAGRYWISTRRTPFFPTAVLVGGAGLGVGLLRTSMLLPALGAIGLLFLLLRPQGRRRSIGFLLIGLITIIVLGAPVLSTGLGSSNFSFVSMGDRLLGGDQYALSANFTWSEQSFGRLLIPGNPWQAVLFTFPRAAFYLMAPLPGIGFNLTGLLEGRWSNWQSLLMILSSVLNLAFFPLAIASLAHSIRFRREIARNLVFHISYWTLFLAIAAGNYIIQERYRVMASLLLWGCIWLGMTATPRKQIRQWYFVWLLILGLGGVLYIAYKFL